MTHKAAILIVILFIGLAALVALTLSQREPVEPEPLVSVGKSTPPIALVDEAGNPVTSDQLHGKIVFLHFWATWCAPCITEIPSISKLYNKYSGSSKIRFLFVLWKDELENAKKFFAENQISLPLVFDPSSTVTDAFGVTGVPETYIIDENGVLLNRILGPAEWDTKEISLYFENLLK